MLLSNPEEPEWLVISIHIHPVARDALGAFLFDLGCEGLLMENSGDQTLKAYLALPRDLEDIQIRINSHLLKLKGIFPEVQSPRVTFSKIKSEDWSRNWRRFFRPDLATPGLMIFPAWEPVPDDLQTRVIRIDPGPAFGTGQHPTTRMSLEAMEGVQLPLSWTMLDVGTGSGILALYGAKLGARRVVAIDTDPEAIRWAHRNIRLNNLSGAIELSPLPLEKLRGTFSLLVANISLHVILKLFPHFSPVLEPRGWVILSGLLWEQVKDVEDRLCKYGFKEDHVLHKEEWATLIARKKVVEGRF